MFVAVQYFSIFDISSFVPLQPTTVRCPCNHTPYRFCHNFDVTSDLYNSQPPYYLAPSPVLGGFSVVLPTPAVGFFFAFLPTPVLGGFSVVLPTPVVGGILFAVLPSPVLGGFFFCLFLFLSNSLISNSLIHQNFLCLSSSFLLFYFPKGVMQPGTKTT